jgi:quercetin dioxygenase-like cupin family protein
LHVRRIVTGHDSEGRAVFTHDDAVPSGRLGAVVWSSKDVPADNGDETDGAAREIGIISPAGSVIRAMSLEPGQRSPMHRTQSLDYGIVLEGEIELELDDGAVRTVRAGEIVVQRGTIHAWNNASSAPCRMVFVLIAAEPLVVNGQAVAPTHS